MLRLICARFYILSLIIFLAVEIVVVFSIGCGSGRVDPTMSDLRQLTKNETTYLRGVVETLDGIAIEGAEVEIDRLPGQKVKTATAGDFSIQDIPGTFGDQARVYVKCPGYKNRDEYIFLPGPVRIRLDRLDRLEKRNVKLHN